MEDVYFWDTKNSETLGFFYPQPTDEVHILKYVPETDEFITPKNYFCGRAQIFIVTMNFTQPVLNTRDKCFQLNGEAGNIDYTIAEAWGIIKYFCSIDVRYVPSRFSFRHKKLYQEDLIRSAGAVRSGISNMTAFRLSHQESRDIYKEYKDKYATP